MSVLFQEEMLADARLPGRVKVLDSTDGKTYLPQSTLDQLNAKFNLTYANYGDRSLEMDIYRPKGVWGELPAIVCIHGGGWAKGNRTSHAKIAQAQIGRAHV